MSLLDDECWLCAECCKECAIDKCKVPKKRGVLKVSEGCPLYTATENFGSRCYF